ASDDLPVTPGCVQPKYGGEPPGRGHPGMYGGDCFVVRLAADGKKILACTYFGGSRQERNTYGLALDSKGVLVLCSATRSSDLRTTAGSLQPRYGGGRSDMFVAKLAPDLKKLVWSTFIGRGQEDWPRGGIALDASDNVFIAAQTGSPDFPVTDGAFQTKQRGGGDAVVVKLAADGSKLLYATLLGGSASDTLMGVRVDAQGCAYLAGHTKSADFPVTQAAPQLMRAGMSDAFFAKLSPDGSRLIYSTYLGGSGNEWAEHPPLLLKDGSVVLAGSVGSDDFPTTPGAFQPRKKGRNSGFVTKLSPDGKRFLFSTVLGGSGGEFWLQPQVDPQGNIVVVGGAKSRDLPVTPGAIQARHGGGKGDGALMILSADGSRLLYGTYLGGRGQDLIRTVAVGPDGALYLAGNTDSPDFPSAPGRPRGNDAFVVKLVPR
ncbi:MAG: SBBP repeat-containing protein, partial [Planctomycetota bacterium]